MPHPSKDQSIPIFTSSSLATVDSCASFLFANRARRPGWILGDEGGGGRMPHASTQAPGFIGLQGINVNKGREAKSSICSPLTPVPWRPGAETL